jgi:Na+-transporting methylmalonyl-CoA/oxaloacetate decarboxylase gamma subunit
MTDAIAHISGTLANAAEAAAAITQPDEGGGLADGLTLMIVGMLVVFVVLAALGGLVLLLVRTFRDEAEEGPGQAPQRATAAASGPASAANAAGQAAPSSASITERVGPSSGGLHEPELIAVLAAAATAALGARVRVKRVIELKDDVRPWISGGRAEVMHSHRVGGGAR